MPSVEWSINTSVDFTTNETVTYSNSNWADKIASIPAYARIDSVQLEIRRSISGGSGNYTLKIGNNQILSGNVTTTSQVASKNITEYVNSETESNVGQLSDKIYINFKTSVVVRRFFYIIKITWNYTPPPTWEYKVFPGTNKCFITKYNGNETDVTVPSTIDGYTVTRLGYGFHVNDFGGSEAANEVTGAAYYGPFSENAVITSVTIPSTVNWIGYQTFRKCTALQSITWNPNEECIIGRTCLHGCTALRLFNVPNNIKEVYDYAFQNCSALNRLNFKNKNVIFKTANNDDTVPVKTFSGTSDSLTLGLYHSVARTNSDAIAGKQIYYYDAAVTFISDGTVLKIDYVDIGAKPTAPPEPIKEGYIFKGWSDGTVTYASGELPAIQSSLSTGAIDVTYTAVFEAEQERPIFTHARMTYGGQQVSETNKVPAGQVCILAVGIK